MRNVSWMLKPDTDIEALSPEVRRIMDASVAMLEDSIKYDATNIFSINNPSKELISLALRLSKGEDTREIALAFGSDEIREEYPEYFI